MSDKKIFILVDDYSVKETTDFDCPRSIRFSINHVWFDVPLYLDDKVKILDLEEHDKAIKEQLLNDLRKLAQADWNSRIVEHLFGKYSIGYVLRDCSTEEILSGINKFTNRNRLKDLLEQNDFSVEEAKLLLED